ncbi:helix-turn-helix domain-containing protein [Saccharomonospora saliphila]|uniref:helix-turn-helix domain-containing protein n=1 Tax=Saccharomonospora saliphila TaxID=369829 RepID=UPI0003733BAA|nr:helix-turn-helix domain-containing protein [Saccharomonospora saliphila]
MNVGLVHQPDFGQRLKRLRRKRGLSQRDVAGDAVNPSYISLLESGARVPTLEVVVQLAEALGVSTDALVGAGLPARNATDGAQEASRLVNQLIARSSLDYGDLPEAEARYEQAYRAARDGGPAVRALEYGLALQEILGARGRPQERYDLLGELADQAARSELPELEVKVEIERASAARDTDRPAEAIEAAERVRDRITGTQLEGTSEHVRLLGVLLSVRCEYGELTEVPGLVERILAVADGIGRDGVRGRAHWAAGVACAYLGWSERAGEHIRQAKAMLGTPATPLQEWARFSRAAASTLLDAGGDLDEVAQYLRVARTALDMVSLPGEDGPIAVLEVRHAVAAGQPARAVELGEAVTADLADAERVRLRIALGRAHALLGDTERAVVELRSAAALAEELSQFRLATRVWRELDEVRSR